MPARHALRDDLSELRTALLGAFAEDPLHNWLYPTDGPAAHAWFDVALRGGLRRGHTYCLADDPGRARRSGPRPTLATSTAARSTKSSRRSAASSARKGRPVHLHGHDGERPASGRAHFYLFVIGVAAQPPGQARGEQLLAPALAICDAQGWPAYLESSNPRNVTFYERLGFTVTHEIPLDTGVGLQGMWRTPRARISGERHGMAVGS